MPTLPCGCTTDGFQCDEHRPRFADSIAADPASICALALFCGMIAVWAAIVG